MIISFIITSKRLFFLTFSLGLGLSVFPNNNDFEVSQDSLQLLQNIVVNKIESEETINVLDDILKIEDLLEDNPELSSSELTAINFYAKGLSSYNFLDYEKALIQADNAILNASETNDPIIKSLSVKVFPSFLSTINFPISQ